MSSDPVIEARRAIRNLLRPLRVEIAHHPYLEALASGEIPIEMLPRFFMERYVAAQDFEALLLAGIKDSLELTSPELGLVLARNLADEIGMDAEGFIRPHLAHETWRSDMLRAIASETGLFVAHSRLQAARDCLEGTTEYHTTIEGLVQEGCGLRIAGAILMLEATIPAEFSQILRCLERSCPRHFLLDPHDDDATLTTKTIARRYLTDHIAHDASSHYPALLEALACEVAPDHRFLGWIQDGLQKMCIAKITFYNCLLATL